MRGGDPGIGRGGADGFSRARSAGPGAGAALSLRGDAPFPRWQRTHGAGAGGADAPAGRAAGHALHRDVPSTDGFLPFITSKNIQLKPAAAAAVLVVVNAETANTLALKAEPALKPNQPNHNKPVPIKT